LCVALYCVVCYNISMNETNNTTDNGGTMKFKEVKNDSPATFKGKYLMEIDAAGYHIAKEINGVWYLNISGKNRNEYIIRVNMSENKIGVLS